MKYTYRIHALDVTALEHILRGRWKSTSFINIGGIAGKIRAKSRIYTYICINESIIWMFAC